MGSSSVQRRFMISVKTLWSLAVESDKKKGDGFFGGGKERWRGLKSDLNHGLNQSV